MEHHASLTFGKNLNTDYWYQDNDISDYIELIIKKELGGYKAGCHFLLQGIGDGCFPEHDELHRYYVAVTPAIDTTGLASPIDFYLDKAKQPAPDAGKPDDRRDVFDELMPVLLNATETHAKILFPYNISLIHWLTGEIKLHQQNHNYIIEICAHDPKGTEQITQDNYAALCHTLEQRIRALDPHVQTIDFSKKVSAYQQPRQAQEDATSCGVIVVEDLLKCIAGDSLNQARSYLIGTKELRQKHIANVEKYLPEQDVTRKGFIERQTRENISSGFKSDKTILKTPAFNLNNFYPMAAESNQVRIMNQRKMENKLTSLCAVLSPEQIIDILKAKNLPGVELCKEILDVRFFNNAIDINGTNLHMFRTSLMQFLPLQGQSTYWILILRFPNQNNQYRLSAFIINRYFEQEIAKFKIIYIDPVDDKYALFIDNLISKLISNEFLDLKGLCNVADSFGTKVPLFENEKNIINVAKLLLAQSTVSYDMGYILLQDIIDIVDNSNIKTVPRFDINNPQQSIFLTKEIISKIFSENFTNEDDAKRLLRQYLLTHLTIALSYDNKYANELRDYLMNFGEKNDKILNVKIVEIFNEILKKPQIFSLNDFKTISADHPVTKLFDEAEINNVDLIKYCNAFLEPYCEEYHLFFRLNSKLKNSGSNAPGNDNNQIEAILKEKPKKIDNLSEYLKMSYVLSHVLELDQYQQRLKSETVSIMLMQALKWISETNHYDLQINSFLQLAKFYQKDEEFIYTAGIYQYLLNLIKVKLVGQSQYQQKIIEIREEIDNNNLTFFRYYNIDNEKYPKFKDLVIKLQQELLTLREQCKQDILQGSLYHSSATKDFDSHDELLKRSKIIEKKYHDITEAMRNLYILIIRESLDILGNIPPCNYTIIGLGSLARQEATPYSDLEFAILIDDNNANSKNYFRKLTYLIYLAVVNLGETILPALAIPILNGHKQENNWFYDNVTPRGFALDGAMLKACKIPVGRSAEFDINNKILMNSFELVDTPENLVKKYIVETITEYYKVLNKKQYAYENSLHLPETLIDACFIIGSTALFDKYKSKLEKYLTAYTDNSNLLYSYKNMRKLGIYILEGNLDDVGCVEEFYPNIAAPDKINKKLTIKHELYRFLQLILSSLAIFYNIKEVSSFRIIEKLHKKDIIADQQTRDNLTIAVSIAQELRLVNYLRENKQNDILRFDNNDKDINFILLKQLLHRIFPFYENIKNFLLAFPKLLFIQLKASRYPTLDDFVVNGSELPKLNYQISKYELDIIDAYIFFRLGFNDLANKKFEAAIKNNNDDYKLFYYYGLFLNIFGNAKAKELFMREKTVLSQRLEELNQQELSNDESWKNSPTYIRNKLYLLKDMAKLNFEIDDITEAVNCCRKALKFLDDHFPRFTRYQEIKDELEEELYKYKAATYVSDNQEINAESQRFMLSKK